MKRHEYLVDLSREHQQALQLGLNAKRVSNADQLAAVMQTYQEQFITLHEPHFAEEEQRLLPKLREAGETELVERVEKDHAELRAYAASIPNWDIATANAFGELMMNHVRFEERTLFPRFETLFLQ